MTPDVEPVSAAAASKAERHRSLNGRLIGIGLVVVSSVLHVGVLVALLRAPDRTPSPEPAIIPVDVVTRKPKPPPPPQAQDAAPTSTETPAAPAPSKAAASTAPEREKAPDGQAPSAAPPPATPTETRFDGLPASFRAIALPATSIGGAEAASYKAIVFGLLAAAKRYPDAARARGAAGAVVVSFSVDTAGRVLRAAVTRGSGSDDLDAEALATVGRCNPFPPPPQGAQTSFAAIIEFGSEE